jgi:hypothetical protein
MTPKQFIELSDLLVKYDNTQGCILEEELPNLLLQFAKLYKKELTDDEIEKFADEELGTIRTDFDFGVIQGMKWYREQIKNR